MTAEPTTLASWTRALRKQLDALGLDVQLAGETEQGVHVLSNAVRGGDNTPKSRQNLAYALALNGNWAGARIMAAEDVPLDQLDARSRRIVEERWLQVNDDGSGGMTLHELAAEYGVSAERIRQIEVKAMQKMRGMLAAVA